MIWVPFGVRIQLNIAHNTNLVLHNGFAESVGQTLDRPLDGIQYPVGNRDTDAVVVVVGVVGGGGHRTANEANEDVRAAKFALASKASKAAANARLTSDLVYEQVCIDKARQ